MTPATKAPPRARTAAARSTTGTRSGTRRATGRQAVRPHRRVSGPARPATRAGSAPRGRAQVATARTITAPLPLPDLGAISLRVLRAGRSLQDSSLLERLVRSRGWIPLLGVLLFGLVAMNVSLLKLNAAAGHNAERAKELRIVNAKLRGQVSRLGSNDRLRAAATGMGLVMPQPKNIHYLTTRPDRDPRQAVRNLKNGVALAMTDDLVAPTPELDSEVASPTPPAGAVVEPAAPAQTGDPAAGTTTTTPAPATGTAPASGATGQTGTTGTTGTTGGGVATGPAATQQTAPTGG